ncbi:MAG TPA: L-arabinose isomerase, partial [Candidatus Methylacidiphilales bacterium]
MSYISTPSVWFVTGSQHLYGEAALKQVAANARQVAGALDASPAIPLPVVFKPIVTTPDEIRALCVAANADPACAGLILWMHTFSPSKMWIGGLTQLAKPFVHFHTQFNRDLPWGEIDMDFMNLNQAAHGDREAGFIHTRLRIERKVVVGHWSDPDALERLGVWARAARAWHDWQGARFVRFGDNMRYVAVTDGNKVSAEAKFGFEVNTHGVGDLVARVDGFSDAEV